MTETLRLNAGVYSVTGTGDESAWFGSEAEDIADHLDDNPEIEVLDHIRHESRDYSWWLVRVPQGADWPKVGKIQAAKAGQNEPYENLETASKPGLLDEIKSDVVETLDDAGAIVTRALIGAAAVAAAVMLISAGRGRKGKKS